MSRPQTARQHEADGDVASHRTATGYRTASAPGYPGRTGSGGSDGPAASPPSGGMGKMIAVGLGVVVLGTVLGLGGAEIVSRVGDSPDGGSDSGNAPAYSLDKITSEIGCTPVHPIKTTDYKQAACDIKGAHYSVTTFTTDEGMKAYLAAADGYGGAYLVGTRWLIIGNTADGLEPMADKLGGSIVEDQGHHGGN